MQKKFYEEIPFVRAIACIMVVFVHVSSGTITAANGSINTLNLYLYELPRLGTPIFAVISAFLLFGSVNRRGFNIKHFLTSRTTKIVLPFIIWTLIYLSFKKYFYSNEIFPDAQSTAKYFLVGTGYYHLYFMITVIQFYIMFPLLQLIRNRKMLLGFFFVSLLVNLYWFTGSKIHTGIDLLDIIIGHRSFLLNWIGFFMFGAVLVSYYSEILKFVKRQKVVLFVSAILIFLALCLEIDPNNIFTSSRPINLLYVPIFVLFLLSIQGLIAKVPFILSGLNIIGNYSMGIYLVHPMVKGILRRNTPPSFWEPELILVTIGIVLLTSLIIVHLIMFLPKANYLIPIGKAKRNSPVVKENLSTSVSNSL
ncbi:surface polysaccharide O-acyltransferase-like enzyme [Planomicrobium soli]|uniref:Surface polysaccharide O-acyltransferase-like enzyme n=1 Tax=Planomicrobium soli TaxID=1176648 RepID=A0A2P8H3J6_9BACL|nr:acyltransferase [Planomicrobium soli]PSL40777.1 surface polysaccharide O-acyltransferase-like enzyme [Planomicrobium soli]